MSLEDLRGRLGAALQDPRRRQLAHIAILEVAMQVGHALESGGSTPTQVEEATEAISAYLKGEIEALPETTIAITLAGTLTETLQRISQEPSFATVFG